jgi:hypothetical protein
MQLELELDSALPLTEMYLFNPLPIPLLNAEILLALGAITDYN